MKFKTKILLGIFISLLFSSYIKFICAEEPESVVISNIEKNIHLLKGDIGEEKKKQYIGNIRLALLQSKYEKEKVRRKVLSKLNADATKGLKIEILPEVINVFQNDADDVVQKEFKKFIQDIKPELLDIVKAGSESSAKCYTAATALTIIQEPESQRFLEQYSQRLNSESARQAASPMSNISYYNYFQEQAFKEHDKRTFLQKLFKIKY